MCMYPEICVYIYIIKTSVQCSDDIFELPKLNQISDVLPVYLWLTSKHNCPIQLAARSHKTNSAGFYCGCNTTLTLHNDNDHETIGGSRMVLQFLSQKLDFEITSKATGVSHIFFGIAI